MTTPSPTVLARLRAETRDEHSAVEAALDLMSATVTVEDYWRTLERFYGFYAPLERALWAHPGLAAHGSALSGRKKTPHLETDLVALGVMRVSDLPLCTDLPPLDTAADCFGCAYVCEGATLGGQIISRHVLKHLGLTPETGARFFYGYGERTGDMWRAFGASLTAFATDPDTQDRVVAAARATFRALRHWHQGDQFT